ncbi:MAG: DNA polymerase III subunit gamma/tau [Bacillota bacterium]
MAFLSLYRKYRPETFNDLVGQEYVVQTLRNALKNQRIAHAYLFAGPRGTGKTSTAKVFAKALNCEDDSSYEPCGVCENCKKISSGQSMDVIEIDAASNRGIDEIRELREKVKFYPSEGTYKVYIIDEVHMLTKGAFNALLKTLEEPPENVIFILATTEPHKVISTILSRCQRFDFSLLSITNIIKRLTHICEKEEVEYEDDALNLIAHSSNGGMRDAISILDQAISFTNDDITADKLRDMLGKIEKGILRDYIKYVAENNTAEALELVNNLIEKGKGVSRFVNDLIEHIRQLLLIRECGINNDLIEYPPSRLKLLKGESEILDSSKLLRMLDILTNIEKDIKFSNQPRLTLEMGVVKMTSPEADDSIQGLKTRVAQLEYELRKNTTEIENRIDKNNSSKNIKAKRDNEESEKKEVESIEREIKNKDDNINKTESKNKVSSSINLEDVRNAWPVILKQVKKEDIKTNAYLKEGNVSKVENSTIFIEFPENKKFHRSGAEKNKKLIKKKVSRVLSKNCELEFVVKGEYNINNGGDQTSKNKKTKKKLEDDDLVNTVLEMFDGKVIETNENSIKD